MTGKLTEAMKRTVILSVVKYMVDKLDGKHPSVRVKHKTAEAIKSTFPKVYRNIEVLLPQNSRNGKLGNAFSNCVKRFVKKFENIQNEDFDDSDSEVMEVGEEDQEEEEEAEAEAEEDGEDEEEDEEEEEEDEEEEGIVYLRHVVPSRENRPIIERYLKETLQQRRDQIMEGSEKYFFDLYWIDPRFILTDFGGLWPELEEKFDEVQQQKFCRFISHLKIEMDKNIDASVMINSETEPYQTLVFLLGRVIGGVAKAATDFVKSIHSQASPTDIEELCGVCSEPFIIVKQTSPTQYIINVDGKPMYLPPQHFATFHQAFDLLVKVYFLFHIEYPENLKKLYSFFAASIYKLRTINKNISTLFEISEKFKKFEEETDSSDDDSEENFPTSDTEMQADSEGNED